METRVQSAWSKSPLREIALAASGGEWVLRLVAWSSLDDSRRSVVRAALVWRWRGKLTRRSRRETVNEDRVMAGPADWVLGRMLRYGDERRALALEAGAAA